MFISQKKYKHFVNLRILVYPILNEITEKKNIQNRNPGVPFQLHRRENQYALHKAI